MQKIITIIIFRNTLQGKCALSFPVTPSLDEQEEQGHHL